MLLEILFKTNVHRNANNLVRPCNLRDIVSKLKYLILSSLQWQQNSNFWEISFKNITISNLNIGKNFQTYVGMTWAEFEQDFFANIWNSFSKTWNPGIIFLTVWTFLYQHNFLETLMADM